MKCIIFVTFPFLSCTRPLLVSVHWLLECAKQGRQVSEGDFLLKDILDVEEAGKENEITFK